MRQSDTYSSSLREPSRFIASKGLPNTVQRTISKILDTSLPTGPIERTITYEAPITHSKSEQ